MCFIPGEKNETEMMRDIFVDARESLLIFLSRQNKEHL